MFEVFRQSLCTQKQSTFFRTIHGNNGSSWTAINNGLTSNLVNTIAISGNNIFAGTYTGVFLSTNSGASWMPVNNGLPANVVFSIAVSGENVFAGTVYNGVFLSTNNGSSWAAVNNGFPAITDIETLFINGTTVLAGTQSNSVWKRPLSEIVGIEDFIQNDNIYIYPNPTTTHLTIHTSSFHKEVTVSIRNVLGQMASPPISLTPNPSPAGEGSASIDISKLPAGMYFLQMKTESGSVVRKFVKE